MTPGRRWRMLSRASGARRFGRVRWEIRSRCRCAGNSPSPSPPAIMDHPPLIAAGELSFTGRSDDIRSLTAEFRRLRRRRLVILGGPGTGKTTLAVQLLNELLATSQNGEPTPVLVSLAGWDPTEQSLHAWLATRLAEGYPSLRAFGRTTAQTLAEQGHLLPILDGLDELPESRQPEVIAALNESLTDTDQLVLTSRTTEYTTAITDAGSVLPSAAVIAPRPLTTAQAADYLEHCLPPEPGASWRELLHRLRTDAAGHLAPVLSTPLGLWLLRTVYIPRRPPGPFRSMPPPCSPPPPAPCSQICSTSSSPRSWPPVPHRPVRATRSGRATRGSRTTCGAGLPFWPGDCTTPTPGTCTGGISPDTPSPPAYSG